MNRGDVCRGSGAGEEGGTKHEQAGVGLAGWEQTGRRAHCSALNFHLLNNKGLSSVLKSEVMVWRRRRLWVVMWRKRCVGGGEGGSR